MACILYIALWAVFPPLQVKMIYRYIALGCMALWLLISFSQIRLTYVNLGSFVYMGIVMAFAISQDGTSALIKQISLYMLIVFLLVNEYYNKRQWKNMRAIIYVILIALIYCNIMTYKEILVNPQITRFLVRDDETLYYYYGKGVGGYCLIYPQVVMYSTVFKWTLNRYREHKFDFTLGSAWCIITALLVFKAGYSIAIFALVIGLCISLFYKRKSSAMAVILAIAALFIATYSITKFEWIQNFLLDTFEGTTVTKKVNDLVQSANDGAVEGSIKARVDAYVNSFSSFLSYPFTGSWMWEPLFGGHSAVFDSFALYGVFGGIFYTYILGYYQFARFKLSQNPQLIRTVNAAITSLMIVATLDTISYQFIPVIFIVIPLLLHDIEGEKENAADEGALDSKLNTDKSFRRYW